MGFFFPLILMLTWMVSVASMVRKLVYEREIQIEEVGGQACPGHQGSAACPLLALSGKIALSPQPARAKQAFPVEEKGGERPCDEGRNPCGSFSSFLPPERPQPTVPLSWWLEFSQLSLAVCVLTP